MNIDIDEVITKLKEHRKVSGDCYWLSISVKAIKALEQQQARIEELDDLLEFRKVEDLSKFKMKGTNNEYNPKVGKYCLISSEHQDDGRYYVFSKTRILWFNDVFILYGMKGYWPVLSRREHVFIDALPKPPEGK